MAIGEKFSSSLRTAEELMVKEQADVALRNLRVIKALGGIARQAETQGSPIPLLSAWYERLGTSIEAAGNLLDAPFELLLIDEPQQYGHNACVLTEAILDHLVDLAEQQTDSVV